MVFACHAAPPMHRPPPQRHGAAAVALFCACMYLCWSRTRMFVRAHAAHLAAWEDTQWWWLHCNDMQFYERLQEHMDICDHLQIIQLLYGYLSSKVERIKNVSIKIV